MKVYLAIIVLIVSYKISPAVTTCCPCKQRIDRLEKTLLDAIRKLSKGPARSCAQILQNNPNSRSGFYTIVNAQGSKQRVFCFMGSLPGCGRGGWRRIASFDRRTGARCPPGFADFRQSGRIACRRTCGAGCQSIRFPAGQRYTRVCGRVQGYQIGTGDSFKRFNSAHNINNINTAYLDGVSITYGRSPRRHLWSYAVAQRHPSLHIICPCTGKSLERPAVPSFVGNHFYCEGGTDGGVNNVLWDGKQCTSFENNGCCNKPNLPWFHRRIWGTNAAIELRLCSDEALWNEKFPIFQYEFYIQ